MVLLLSEHTDYSTSKVIKWLCHFDQKFVRLNGEDEVQLSKVELGERSKWYLKHQGKTIDLNQIKSFWYRRGKINLDTHTDSPKDPAFPPQLKGTLNSELTIVEHFLYHHLNQKKALGNFHQGGVNKLIALEKARACGLRVPDTLICSRKSVLKGFLEKHHQLICKPIYEMPLIKGNQGYIPVFTQLVDRQLPDQLDETFFPSLFQEYIRKKYEIRVFYLNGDCFANAIFTQSNQQSAIDFRNTEDSSFIRRVPFNVPAELKSRLKQFMASMELNTGSIDLIRTPEGKFVFLEVNPVGQFGMTSYVGNYQIEKIIANYLKVSPSNGSE